MNEPSIITDLRARLDSDPAHDELFYTFVGRTSRGLPIRPRVLSEKENGEKIYGITRKQAAKLVKYYDDARSGVIQ